MPERKGTAARLGPRLGTARGAKRPARLALRLLPWAALLAMPVTMYAALVYAPTEAIMGDVQRIFYIHVPAAWVAFLAFFVTFLGGALYLVRRQDHWDAVAVSSAEIGVIFTSLALVLGSLWAKPVWGAWWTWDPRLITTLFLWLTYVGYLLLRNAIEDPERRARVAAVFGIVGFVDVPIVFMSIRWWRTIHPVLFTRGSLNLEEHMVVALVIGLVSLTLLYAALLALRFSVENAQRRSDRLRQVLEEEEM